MKKVKRNDIMNIGIISSIILAVIFDFVNVQYSDDITIQRFLSDIIPLLFSSFAVTLLIIRSELKIFKGCENLIYLIPCFIIAIDNFPFYSYFQGNMQIIHDRATDYLCFISYCLLVGFFEECVFRGVVFSFLANTFSNDKKGFLMTYVISSVVFGTVHLLNIFSGANPLATILQVGYSTLTGGLFAFAFIKTKNILFAALTHSIYNFCGLYFTSTQGLGSGVIFDFPTGLIMAIVSILVGGFVLYSVWKYPEEERNSLYQRLNVHQQA